MDEATARRKHGLSHLRRLYREGTALQAAEELDNARYGRWCYRVERYVERALPEPLGYPAGIRLDFAPVRSPLDRLYSGEEAAVEELPLKPIGAVRIIGQLLAILASAIERMELLLERETGAGNEGDGHGNSV